MVVSVPIFPAKYFRLGPMLVKAPKIHTESIFRHELISCLGKFSPRRPPGVRKKAERGNGCAVEGCRNLAQIFTYQANQFTQSTKKSIFFKMSSLKYQILI